MSQRTFCKRVVSRSLSELIVIVLLLILSLSGARALASDLTSDIETLIAQSGIDPKATVAVYVVDAQTSEVLVNRHGEKPMIPASNNKLLTTAAGLSLLGPEHRFVTKLYTDGPLTTPTLPGNLYVVGGGDPTISGRFEPNKRDVTAPLRRWADTLTSLGITRIRGRILADDTLFDNEYFHPNWYPGERGEWYEAEISALAFNDNCVDLLWSAEQRMPGDLADVTLNPPTRYVRLHNHVRVVAKGRSAERWYLRKAGSNDIVATGTLTVGTTKEDSASVNDGALYFATVFHEVLTSAGITVEGKPKHVRPTPAEQRRYKRVLIAERESPPLREIVKVINLVSQNFYADCLLKYLGRIKHGEGSFDAGCRVVMDFCRKQQLYHEGHRMVDGSGLADRNRVTPRQLVEVIRFMDQGPYRTYWRESLPIGGERGSLKSRFQETTETRTRARFIMGKTGLIDEVRSLSGIVRTDSGRERYYSIIVNGFRRDGQRVIQLIDRIAVALTRD
ncbi:MAG: D-alanyl-D-alanine carboxypeptidase/D-alanyl-D-alanine-endopeptidase [Candidatus Sumerlaea chitinivorans]|nr:D-alanyl-D-alanine carboxypeptidase/D-alanyl-D-alanine-endopeptidase [Candidatus Sumerlaea chitinivorans]